MRIFSFIILSILICNVFAWDNDDLEVFDVVEEVNQNFYDLMGVVPEASPAEIKSAFKKLTLKLHPDKNDAPDADVQFRNLVSVHNILKDAGKREKYNEVLKNGLPNWRSAVYYYRHVRKMGLAEMSIILFIIISFGQYVVGWASYAEKCYTAEQVLSTKFKRAHKRGTNIENDVQEILKQIPRPSVKNTLPFQIPKFIFWSIVSLPSGVMAARRYFKERHEEKMREEKRLEEERLQLEQDLAEAAEAKANRGARRRKKAFVPQERDDVPVQIEVAPVVQEEEPNIIKVPIISGGFWSDDDLAELIRLVKKHPGGTSERWERIAEAMGRSVNEVTHMAAKLKENCYKLPGQEETEAPPPEPPQKVKTRKATEDNDVQSNWNQTQQKALEAAILKYPKTFAGDRWEKIAHCVPDKTKEECMLRYKYLVGLVTKKKKEQEEINNQTEAEPQNESQNDGCDTTQRSR